MSRPDQRERTMDLTLAVLCAFAAGLATAAGARAPVWWVGAAVLLGATAWAAKRMTNAADPSGTDGVGDQLNPATAG